MSRFFKIDIKNQKNRYELDSLIREFLRPEEFIITGDERSDELYPAKLAALAESADAPEAGPDGKKSCGAVADAGASGARGDCTDGLQEVCVEIPERMDKNAAKRAVYDELAALTGYRPEWGTLTGVRPTKLVNELMARESLSFRGAGEILRRDYYVSDEKISLLLETCGNQSFLTSKPAGRSVGVYIGIPFCPTRCLYCSFTSNQADAEEIERYLSALFLEIESAGERLKSLNVDIESLYIGGGTPTSLDEDQLDRLLSCVRAHFNLAGVKEFCVEAGRPDTITAGKLAVLRNYGADRISINPQSMNGKTLSLIGRSHDADDIYRAFEIADGSGIPLVNTDIIAGLPGEDYDMFMHTLDEVISLSPSNITVHTLAVKRASRLIETDSDYHYRQRGGDVGRMVSDARRKLAGCGYHPYYMYRQKHMAGNFENVGYAKKGTESVYNIRIMDEHQTIAAIGAGGISKAYYHDENRLERVPNVSNYRIYIDRIDEMIKRKKDKLYGPFE